MVESRFTSHEVALAVDFVEALRNAGVSISTLTQATPEDVTMRRVAAVLNTPPSPGFAGKDVQLEDTSLDVRVTKVLLRNYIKTVRQLTLVSAAELYQMTGIDHISITTIERMLDGYSSTLRNEHEDIAKKALKMQLEPENILVTGLPIEQNQRQVLRRAHLSTYGEVANAGKALLMSMSFQTIGQNRVFQPSEISAIDLELERVGLKLAD